MRKYRKFTKEFKLGILRELENGKKVTELSREHDLKAKTIYRWKSEHKENPKEAFKGKGNTYKLNAKVAERERLIGQLYAENDILKKALEKFESRLAEEIQKKRCLK